LAQFPDLEELTIDDNLTSFDIKNIQNLKSLCILDSKQWGRKNDSDLITISQLPRLEHLELSGVPINQLQIQDCQNLKILKLNYCYNLKLGHFPNLERLEISRCDNLQLSNLGNYQQLRHLKIGFLEGPLDLSKYPHIERLQITNSQNPFLKEKCNSLESLCLVEVGSLGEDLINQLPHLESLRIEKLLDSEIKFSHHLKLKSLILVNSNLTSLNISEMSNLEELDIEKCDKLTKLNLPEHSKLKCLKIGSASIEKLDLSGCRDLEELIISDPSSLLSIKNCSKLKRLEITNANYKTLEGIDFHRFPELESITIHFNGNTYELSKWHKIVTTNNPESYPGCYYHRFLQNAETIYYKMPNEARLRAILVSSLQQHGLQDYANAIITAYQLIQSHNPISVYSIRALQNLAERFIMLTDKCGQPSNTLVWQAALGEFAGSIQGHDKREGFSAALVNELKVTIPDDLVQDLIPISSYVIPKEKAYLVEGIKQDLLLRDRAIAHDTKALEKARKEGRDPNEIERLYHKQLLLVEGPSGIGKSTLFKILLEEQGFSKTSLNLQKKYYEITVDNQGQANTILEKASQDGAIVILDEFR
jgi:MoxR-like ATPase